MNYININQYKIIKSLYSFFNKKNVLYSALFIAVLFHVSGSIGMLTQSRDWFIDMTPLTFIVMALLIYITDTSGSIFFKESFIVAFCIGFSAEIIGVNTGLLFGSYQYDSSLGIKVLNTPILIGLMWFMTIYGIANFAYYLNEKMSASLRIENHRFFWGILAGVITTFFDYILEPAAIKLGYWSWSDEVIPWKNYLSWFLISSIIYLILFHRKVRIDINYFAILLVAIQVFFFLFVRTFL